jgi:hypothetical protein
MEYRNAIVREPPIRRRGKAEVSSPICHVSNTRLQNGAFRRVGGITVHTTYLTGLITGLISTEAENYISGLPPTPGFPKQKGHYR